MMDIDHKWMKLAFLQAYRCKGFTGKNPNVAAVIVIGIEPKWTKRIVDEIAKTGKPVEGFSIEGVGDINTIAKVFMEDKDKIYIKQDWLFW